MLDARARFDARNVAQWPRRPSMPAPGRSAAAWRILTGCAQPVLDPGINEAAIRLLTRLGVEVVRAEGRRLLRRAGASYGPRGGSARVGRHNIDAWTREIETGGLDAIIITASGCGTTIKDYGFMLRLDPAYAEKAARVSALAKDITEYLADARPAGAGAQARPRRRLSFRLLDAAWSEDHAAAEGAARQGRLRRCASRAKGHLCCGSAGTYNILQPEIAATLRDRKVRNIEATGADIVATGNIGCITQIAPAARMPIVHTVELLDWAYGGPSRKALRKTGRYVAAE